MCGKYVSCGVSKKAIPVQEYLYKCNWHQSFLPINLTQLLIYLKRLHTSWFTWIKSSIPEEVTFYLGWEQRQNTPWSTCVFIYLYFYYVLNSRPGSKKFYKNFMLSCWNMWKKTWCPDSRIQFTPAKHSD